VRRRLTAVERQWRGEGATGGDGGGLPVDDEGRLDPLSVHARVLSRAVQGRRGRWAPRSPGRGRARRLEKDAARYRQVEDVGSFVVGAGGRGEDGLGTKCRLCLATL
jgi:hypothetical protein